jgi:chromosome segregation ATPase
MTEPSEFGDRIAKAMGRIEAALEASQGAGGYSEADLDAARAQERAAADARLEAAETELARLREALAAEQTAGAQLRERVDALRGQKDAEAAKVASLEAEAARLRSDRSEDRAELDDLIAALKPLVTEGA